MRDALHICFHNLNFWCFQNLLAATFFRIKGKGVKDKLPWDMENERYVLHEVLKEGVQSEVLKEVRSRLREQKMDSKQPGY